MKINTCTFTIICLTFATLFAHGMSDLKPKVIYGSTLGINWCSGILLGVGIAQKHGYTAFLEQSISPLARIASSILPYAQLGVLGLLFYVGTLVTVSRPGCLCGKSENSRRQRRWYMWYMDSRHQLSAIPSLRHLLFESPFGIMFGTIGLMHKLHADI